MTTYRHRVAVCPTCGMDLDDEGFGFWCSSCRCAWPFSYVIFPEDLDDDEDRHVT
jgi:tRNA(Ile2) C34 agmatinyltransferase TiaS